LANTDAEGRLVLADALAEADAERPALLIDIWQRLTGAARVGGWVPSCPPAFSTDENLLATLRIRGEEEADPIWPLPLWGRLRRGAREQDCRPGATFSAAPFRPASIIGALFLKRFVTATPFVAAPSICMPGTQRTGRAVRSAAEAQCNARALQADTLARLIDPEPDASLFSSLCAQLRCSVTAAAAVDQRS